MLSTEEPFFVLIELKIFYLRLIIFILFLDVWLVGSKVGTIFTMLYQEYFVFPSFIQTVKWKVQGGDFYFDVLNQCLCGWAKKSKKCLSYEGPSLRQESSMQELIICWECCQTNWRIYVTWNESVRKGLFHNVVHKIFIFCLQFMSNIVHEILKTIYNKHEKVQLRP
jgi:hypothetical protein